MIDSMFSIRRTTYSCHIGHITVGSESPIVVQSMTNTDTANIDATVTQVKQLAETGSELVRLTVNTPEAAAAIAPIRTQLDKDGYTVPLIGDFHFNGDRLLKDFPDCAAALAKYRINPGNVGKGARGDEKFAFMIEQAIKYSKAIRIGVNWGSLDQILAKKLLDENRQKQEPLPVEEVMRAALVESALSSAQKACELGLPPQNIVLSCKVSNVQDLIQVYTRLASNCHYPLHLGLTEAGMGSKGIVASSAALAILLQQGIGDTIRISLTPEPGGSRTQEVIVAQQLLQSMGLRNFMPMVVSCPGCGRTSSSVFQELAQDVQNYLQRNMPLWRKKYPGVEKMHIAVMGCVVNGPGESKLADIGISLPGSGETPVAPVYINGEKSVTLKGENIAQDFFAIIDRYVKEHYGTE